MVRMELADGIDDLFVFGGVNCDVRAARRKVERRDAFDARFRRRDMRRKVCETVKGFQLSLQLE